jgi:hypothetical protein
MMRIAPKFLVGLRPALRHYRSSANKEAGRTNKLPASLLFTFDAFAKKHQCQWLSKKRQMQGARLSSNEAYLGTSKQ